MAEDIPIRRLCGVFDWSGDNTELVPGEDCLSSGMIDLVVRDTPGCFVGHRPFFHNARTGVHCAFFGYLANLDDVRARYDLPRGTPAEVAERAFSADRLFDLDGMYHVVTVDETRKRCTVSQSPCCTSLPLYYAAHGQRFVFATSLKDLLARRGGDREFEHRAARDFLHYAYMIPNEKTLLRGVSKLVPGQQLVVDYGRRSFAVSDAPRESPRTSFDRSRARARLLDSIMGRTASLSRQMTSCARQLTLTAGWDCNLLLHALRRSFDGPITAVTLGVGDTFDETARAKAIVEQAYERTSHLSISVPRDCVTALPAIVWESEGYLFESGVFLRHHLGGPVVSNVTRVVFLGVGADQVLFAETALKQLLRSAKNSPDPVWRFRRSVRPVGTNTGYTILIDYNLKMHELVLNAHGGMGLYPFVNRETMELSRALGIVLNWRKRYYRRQLADVLGPAVTRHIAPKGPVLDTGAVFRASRDAVLRSLNGDLLHTWLTPVQVDNLLSNPDKYHVILLHLAYLSVFHRLFVEDFDRHRDERLVDIPLSELAG